MQTIRTVPPISSAEDSDGRRRLGKKAASEAILTDAAEAAKEDEGQQNFDFAIAFS
jgi:hypothetical protein